jgi:hypothetical protein
VPPRKTPESAANPDTMLDELESEIEALRIAYEKYFLGVERAAPVRQRERLERKLRGLEGISFRTTVLRFRMGGLRARYITYAHYWTRILDQMERGVSRRDLQRQAREPARAAAAAPPASTPTVREAPTAALVDPDNARDVFDRLVAAKQSVGESTEGMTFPAFLRKLSREAPKIAEQHGGAALRFDVEIAAGKVRVRARPR